MDEAQCIARALEGDLEAFNQLVLAYQDSAYNLAYRMLNDPDAAADVTQSAFIAAYRSLKTYRGGSFRAWVLRMVTNACYDELRRRKRRPTVALEPLNRDEEEIESPAWLMEAIHERLSSAQERYGDLEGVRKMAEDSASRQFVDLCGQLRFQVRWANLHRTPRTSVLGHSLFVALLAYLFSIQVGACRRRAVNNFFTGLFHDLPEVLTRDIISPVKRSIEGLDVLIKEYEKEMMEKEFYGLLPPDWHFDLRLYTEDEFESIVILDGKRRKLTSEEIGHHYNEDAYAPRDGELVKAADRLAAFIEAYVAIRNGSAAQELHEAVWAIRAEQGLRRVGGIDLGGIYADFD